MRAPLRADVENIRLVQSSHTKYDYAGQTTDFMGEQPHRRRRSARGPDAARRSCEFGGVTRLVIYGEYLDTALRTDGPTAPPTVPRYDIRDRSQPSIGDWFK